MNKWVCIAYGTMWLAVALGVVAGLYFTKSAWCMWAFILPSTIKIHFGDKEGIE